MPGGTVVGCNAWTPHQNKKGSGKDAGIFRPERWLEGEGADRVRLGKMSSSMFHGSRTCIERDARLMETYKLVLSSSREFVVSHVEYIERETRANRF